MNILITLKYSSDMPKKSLSKFKKKYNTSKIIKVLITS